ncbi:hypothetical protein ACQP3C_30435, partial [Escherichia coli]
SLKKKQLSPAWRHKALIPTEGGKAVLFEASLFYIVNEFHGRPCIKIKQEISGLEKWLIW